MFFRFVVCNRRSDYCIIWNVVICHVFCDAESGYKTAEASVTVRIPFCFASPVVSANENPFFTRFTHVINLQYMTQNQMAERAEELFDFVCEFLASDLCNILKDAATRQIRLCAQ